MIHPRVNISRCLPRTYQISSLIRGSRNITLKRKVEIQTFSHFKVRESPGIANLFSSSTYILSPASSFIRLSSSFIPHPNVCFRRSAQASFQQPIRPTSRYTGELQVFSEFQPCDPLFKKVPACSLAGNSSVGFRASSWITTME